MLASSHLDLTEWLGIAQTVVTVIAAIVTALAAFFAWKAVEVAKDAQREAARERRSALLSHLAETVGELERSKRWGGTTRDREVLKDRLLTIITSLGAARFPQTQMLAHWNPAVGGSDEVFDAARIEISTALDECLGH